MLHLFNTSAEVFFLKWRYVLTDNHEENKRTHPFIQWNKAHPLVDPFLIDRLTAQLNIQPCAIHHGGKI